MSFKTVSLTELQALSADDCRFLIFVLFSAELPLDQVDWARVMELSGHRTPEAARAMFVLLKRRICVEDAVAGVQSEQAVTGAEVSQESAPPEDSYRPGYWGRPEWHKDANGNNVGQPFRRYCKGD